MKVLLFALAGIALAIQEDLETVVTFEGTAVEAMNAIVELAPDEPDRAGALANELASDETRDEALRAEFRYAEGLVRAQQEVFRASSAAFASCRALAGPGELRVLATYNQGTVELLQAEAERLATYERLEAQAASGQPPPETDESPFAVLRVLYLRAKATLLEGLRADFSHEDTRANLELIQRRLAELDELEQQSEEQEQPEQQPEEGEEGDEEQEEGEGEEGEGEGSEGEDQEGEQQEGENQEQGEPPPDQGEGAAEETNQESMPQNEELPEVQEHEMPEQAAERLLTREEVMRLLDKLGQLEEEADALETLLRASQRIPVEKDW